jgi:hypothetical protein
MKDKLALNEGAASGLGDSGQCFDIGGKVWVFHRARLGADEQCDARGVASGIGRGNALLSKLLRCGVMAQHANYGRDVSPKRPLI